MPDQVNTDNEDDDDNRHEAAYPVFGRNTSLRLATALLTNESSGEASKILDTNQDITGNNQASEDKMPEEDSLDSSSKSQSLDSQTRNETLASNSSNKDIGDQTSEVSFDTIDASVESVKGSAKVLNETSESAKAMADAPKVLNSTSEASVETTAEAMADAPEVLNDTSEASVETTTEAIADPPEILNDTSEASVETTTEAIADPPEILNDTSKSEDEHDDDNCKHELVSRTSTLIMDTAEALSKGTITEMNMADVSYLLGKNHQLCN